MDGVVVERRTVVHALAVACALAFAHASPVELIAQAVLQRARIGRACLVHRLRRRPAGRADDHLLRPGGPLRQVRDRGGRHLHLPADRPGQRRWPDAPLARERDQEAAAWTKATSRIPRLPWRSRPTRASECSSSARCGPRARYPLSGNTNLVEALARAGSTLPTASGEAVIVHAGENAAGPTLPTQTNDADIVRVEPARARERRLLAERAADGRRHHLRAAGAERLRVRPGEEPGRLQPAAAEHDRAPGAVARRRRHRPRQHHRIKIIRIVDGKKKELKANLTDLVEPGDTIVVRREVFLMTDYSFDGKTATPAAEAGAGTSGSARSRVHTARTRAIRSTTPKSTSSTT